MAGTCCWFFWCAKFGKLLTLNTVLNQQHTRYTAGDMKLLFICTHNRCRSILAEAVANHVGDGQIQAFSAGSSPQTQVHPLSLHFLTEKGIDIEGLNSQSWNDFSDLNPDAILTLCDSAAAEVCPVWFDDSVQVHWGLSDPSGGDVAEHERDQHFTNTIEVLEQRIQALMSEDNLGLRGAALQAKLTDIAEQIL